MRESPDSAKLVRRALGCLDEGDVEAAIGYTHPEIEWIAPAEWLEQRVYRGHEGLRKLDSHWRKSFDDYRLDVDRVIEFADDRCAVLVHQRGQIKGSGAPIQQQAGYLVEIRDAKVVRVDAHFSWEDTLEAAGLGRELEPPRRAIRPRWSVASLLEPARR